MKIKEIFIKSIVIIFLGWFIISLDEYFFPKSIYAEILIPLVAFLKIIFFVYQSYNIVIQVIEHNVSYHRFLIITTFNIFFIICSFAVDYASMYHINQNSFEGISPDFSLGEIAFESFYFSVLNYTNFGYGEIIPKTIPSKCLVMMEDLISFLTILYILTDFVTLKQSIEESAFMRRKKEKPAINE
ncbi:MAG: ion channel [Thermoflexibacter sp.]|nr:ion channel [Thermoflexibacter sp.]